MTARDAQARAGAPRSSTHRCDRKPAPTEPIRGYSMRGKPASKYELMDLYQEIGLFDRKIAYCQSFEKFDSEQARTTARKKLVTKRESLVKSALDAVSRGIACDPKYLPRSFKESAAADKVAS